VSALSSGERRDSWSTSEDVRNTYKVAGIVNFVQESAKIVLMFSYSLSSMRWDNANLLCYLYDFSRMWLLHHDY